MSYKTRQTRFKELTIAVNLVFSTPIGLDGPLAYCPAWFSINGYLSATFYIAMSDISRFTTCYNLALEGILNPVLENKKYVSKDGKAFVVTIPQDFAPTKSFRAVFEESGSTEPVYMPFPDDFPRDVVHDMTCLYFDPAGELPPTSGDDCLINIEHSGSGSFTCWIDRKDLLSLTGDGKYARSHPLGNTCFKDNRHWASWIMKSSVSCNFTVPEKYNRQTPIIWRAKLVEGYGTELGYFSGKLLRLSIPSVVSLSNDVPLALCIPNKEIDPVGMSQSDVEQPQAISEVKEEAPETDEQPFDGKDDDLLLQVHNLRRTSADNAWVAVRGEIRSSAARFEQAVSINTRLRSIPVLLVPHLVARLKKIGFEAEFAEEQLLNICFPIDPTHPLKM